ncbi:hypothetical protein J4465_00600 [Candidatus Pacearchaeota archaeon]|nr:hypothetical protein [Candidatus Pacearchaeota archaeon]
MKKRGKLNREFAIFALILIALLFVVSGQTSCPGQGTTDASKTGLDFSLNTNPNFLYGGKTLEQGENFRIGIIIENYDQTPRQGKICVLDDVSDNFLGISSNGDGQCASFNVRAAEISEQKSQALIGGGTSKKIIPGTVEIYFPENNWYKYQGLPKMGIYNGRMIVSAFYVETSRATATLNVPSTQQPITTQEPSPIGVSLSQSSYRVAEGYQTDLTISLIKKFEHKIYSSDFTKENNIYFNAEVPPQQLICAKKNGEAINQYFELGNENIIKCSFLSYSENIQGYPFVSTLNYGVKISKGFTYQIKT